MSGFYSKCLIWGVDSDADSMKAISENPVKIWDVLSEMAFLMQNRAMRLKNTILGAMRMVNLWNW